MTRRMIRKSDSVPVVSNLEVADRFFARLVGLIGRKSFQPGQGLLFPRCTSIHMWMMSIPIDAVFLKKRGTEWEVLSLHPELRPWRPLPVGNHAADDVLELPEGSIGRIGLKAGEVLCIVS